MMSTGWTAQCFRHRLFTVGDGTFVVYADRRMNLPSYSEWMVPGSWLGE